MTAATVPLCVDLDGTLIRTDILHEMLAGTLREPATLMQLPGFLIRGKASLKTALASRSSIDIESLPYHQPLVDWLRTERANGRRLALATAAPERMANAIAAHLGLFDLVLATSADENLRGEAKAVALVRRFGERGFDYVGNDSSDLAVWKHANAAILVDASPSLRTRAYAATRIDREFPRTGRWRVLVRALRPHQWSKNILVFVPVFTSGEFGAMHGRWAASIAFAAFSAAASGTYLVNDLTDLRTDRRHALKKGSPFASGGLPPIWGFIAAPVLLTLGVVVGALAGITWFTVAYCVLAIGYSVRLKEWAPFDLLALTTLYTLRLYAGGEASSHHVSRWLLAFAGFFFFSLAAMKRASELVTLPEGMHPARSRAKYGRQDLRLLTAAGGGAAVIACVVLAVYVRLEFSGVSDPLGRQLWSIVPLVLIWLGRMWLATTRGDMEDDPIVFAARDWFSWLAAASILVVFTAARLHR